MKTEVLLADEQPIIRFGLAQLLAPTHDLVAAGEATTAMETLRQVRARDWGLVVLELGLPGATGTDMIRLLRQERPSLQILIFTDRPEESFALRAIRAGAVGYLSKHADGCEVLLAMRRVAAGGVFVTQKVTELLAGDISNRDGHPPHTLLTDREYGIFHRIVRGERLTDIAEDLSLSIKTVSTHKSHILGKMTLGGHVDLVRYAIEHKLLDVARE